MEEHQDIHTLGQLRKTGYQSLPLKDELRKNLIEALREGKQVFPEIKGYEDTVIPDLEKAILSRHNILLLGLRGQAKTRIARLLIHLLDEYIPIIAGNEINDDPLQPISNHGIKVVQEKGDDTPIEWMHRSERFIEKLATPDVSIADLIGDVDPIKAASLKLPYSDERVIHFGLVPRAHRSIFVLNELPDLQARIQVALLNILQEGDIQIRGFKLRLPLDIQFVFTANPEDYTHRGSIITPLKDRIESQILTHYPKSTEISKSITRQESRISKSQSEKIFIPEILEDLIEKITFQAREHELVDENSGVSARMSIAAKETLYSTAERRMLMNKEDSTQARIMDIWGVAPAITGKLELMYEGEQSGIQDVVEDIINDSIQELFLDHFQDPNHIAENQESPYVDVKNYFEKGGEVKFSPAANNKDHLNRLKSVDGLEGLAGTKSFSGEELPLVMELILFGLSSSNVIQKEKTENTVSFSDPLSGIFDDDVDD